MTDLAIIFILTIGAFAGGIVGVYFGYTHGYKKGFRFSRDLNETGWDMDQVEHDLFGK